MTQDQVAQAVLADLRMTGFKRPKLLVLKDNRSFSVVLTGLNLINNSTQIAAIDVNTREQIQVPMSCVVEFKEIC